MLMRWFIVCLFCFVGSWSVGKSQGEIEGGTLQCIKYADVALYNAKEAGRNKAVRFDEEMWSGEEF